MRIGCHDLRHVIGATGLKTDFGDHVIGFAFDDFRHRLDFRCRTALCGFTFCLGHQAGHIPHQHRTAGIQHAGIASAASLGGRQSGKIFDCVVVGLNDAACRGADNGIGQNVIGKAGIKIRSATGRHQCAQAFCQCADMGFRIVRIAAVLTCAKQLGQKAFGELVGMFVKNLARGVCTRKNCIFR